MRRLSSRQSLLTYKEIRSEKEIRMFRSTVVLTVLSISLVSASVQGGASKEMEQTLYYG
jgi:hypothetical protein